MERLSVWIRAVGSMSIKNLFEKPGSEIDTATRLFPIAEARRVRTVAPADLSRRRLRGRSRRRGCIRRRRSSTAAVGNFVYHAVEASREPVEVRVLGIVCQKQFFAGTRMPPYVARVEFGFRERSYFSPMTMNATRLEHLSVLLVSGPDARNFLQGQLSADMHSLAPDNIVLASCNSPQGRVQAVVWTLERPEGIALLVSRSVADAVETRLRRYILRAKLTIERDRLWAGVLEESIATEANAADRSHELAGELSRLRWSGLRHPLVLTPNVEMAHDAAREARWRSEYLGAGLPQVYAETYERFVAQMLNLDVLDGISFTKGCYTGQEIVARAHYRGAVKRRMFRFRAACAPPAPGTRVLAGDQHAGEVVDAVPAAEGCELLAVVSLPSLHEPLKIDAAGNAALERLALPYEAALTGMHEQQ